MFSSASRAPYLTVCESVGVDSQDVVVGQDLGTSCTISVQFAKKFAANDLDIANRSYRMAAQLFSLRTEVGFAPSRRQTAAKNGGPYVVRSRDPAQFYYLR